MDLNNDYFALQKEDLRLNESDSLIAKVCDQFNLKDIIIKISKRASFKVTSEFIDAFILFTFFLIVFSEAGILKLEYSFHMIVLTVIGVSTLVEFFYINTSMLKKYFSRDENTKRFLLKMHTLSPRETKDEMKNLFFSSKCINYFLHSIANEEKEYPPYVFESILSTQVLSKENFDLFFSPSVLNKILPDVIIIVLSKYRDCLTYKHVLNTYNQFKNNDSILRVLIATQNSSYLLIGNFIDDKKLVAYYTDYQLNKKHIDWKLKIIPLKWFRTIESWTFRILTFFFVVSFFVGEKVPINVKPLDLIGILIGSLFLSALFAYGLLGSIFGKIINCYHQHFISNILK